MNISIRAFLSSAQTTDTAQSRERFWRGFPCQIRMNTGPELTSQALREWAEKLEVHLAYIQPGKPDQNAYVERFNQTYREVVLDANLFSSLQKVRDITEDWVEEYNAVRPHDALEGVPSYQYLTEWV